jgi:hypothetical protein
MECLDEQKVPHRAESKAKLGANKSLSPRTSLPRLKSFMSLSFVPPHSIKFDPISVIWHIKINRCKDSSDFLRHFREAPANTSLLLRRGSRPFTTDGRRCRS